MNCSSDGLLGEAGCREMFSSCSDQITQEDQWQGLPSVPGLDIHSTLQQSESGFISCILGFYNCSSSKSQCKAEFNKCARQYPVGAGDDNTSEISQGNSPNSNVGASASDGASDGASVGAGASDGASVGDSAGDGASVGDSAGASAGSNPRTQTNNGRKNDVPETEVSKPLEVQGSGDVYTPSLAGGSGKIPESKSAELFRKLIGFGWTLCPRLSAFKLLTRTITMVLMIRDSFMLFCFSSMHLVLLYVQEECRCLQGGTFRLLEWRCL